FTIENGQSAAGGAAKPVGLLQYRVEHRREVSRRVIDDLQYLGGGGLLGEGLVAFAPKVGADLRRIRPITGIVEDHGLTYLFNFSDPPNLPDAIAATGRSRCPVSGIKPTLRETFKHSRKCETKATHAKAMTQQRCRSSTRPGKRSM